MEAEKESAEEEEELHQGAVNYQDFPIMHWEDLALRIAELEKLEQERARKRTGEGEGGALDEEEDLRRCRLAIVSSRFLHHRNLQLCFTNNSDSDDEEEKGPTSAGHHGCHGTGLKQEVAAALRALRDKLLAEQKEECVDGSSCLAEREHLERSDLQERSLQQLCGLRASLQQEVHALSSELVAQLLVRDQLRTRQDAMLLDVQDLT
ncbi:schwannomin-interacting protein 1 isoform X2 [Oryzias latipes]|uniref:schwannomin-interacting protein 1 isoform X2 n=1 Tax=Oryzias latipes TaxID=8090 RepID=UPI0005CC69FD|nr:schwannomin-interacting protein 1 isoform X2 [Oryzias latipes]